MQSNKTILHSPFSLCDLNSAGTAQNARSTQFTRSSGLCGRVGENFLNLLTVTPEAFGVHDPTLSLHLQIAPD
jgi:hypothetical protein